MSRMPEEEPHGLRSVAIRKRYFLACQTDRPLMSFVLQIWADTNPTFMLCLGISGDGQYGKSSKLIPRSRRESLPLSHQQVLSKGKHSAACAPTYDTFATRAG